MDYAKPDEELRKKAHAFYQVNPPAPPKKSFKEGNYYGRFVDDEDGNGIVCVFFNSI